MCNVYCSPLDQVEPHLPNIPLEVKVHLEGKNTYMKNFYFANVSVYRSKQTLYHIYPNIK